MKFPEPDINRPSRGSIIIDADILMTLFYPLEEKYKRDDTRIKPKTLFNVIEYLANIGFDVYIPEMVSYEVARISTAGCADDAFPKHAISTTSHFDDPNLPDRKSGLAKIIEKQNNGTSPNIHITRSPRLFSPQITTEGVHNLYQEQRRFMSKFNSVFYDLVVPSAAATKALVELQEHYKQLSNLGDAACIELVQFLKHRNTLPVYLFSNDRAEKHLLYETLPYLNGAEGFGCISLTGFLSAGGQSKLFHECGLRINPDSYGEFLTEFRHYMGQEKISQTLNLVDSNIPYCDGHKFIESSRPFYKQLKSIAEEMNLEEKYTARIEKKRELNVHPPIQKSQTAKFTERYAKRANATNEGRLN